MNIKDEIPKRIVGINNDDQVEIHQVLMVVHLIVKSITLN